VLPPDYVPQILEDFTMICHLCFMEVSASQSLEDSKPPGISTGQIFSNLVSVFNPLTRKGGNPSADHDAAGILYCNVSHR